MAKWEWDNNYGELWDTEEDEMFINASTTGQQGNWKAQNDG
jgi:hypothetical protein